MTERRDFGDSRAMERNYSVMPPPPLPVADGTDDDAKLPSLLLQKHKPGHLQPPDILNADDFLVLKATSECMKT